MSHESDIKGYLEDRPTAKVHETEIMGALPYIGQAAVHAVLVSLAKRGEITKVRTAVYQHKPADAPAPDKSPWLAEGLAPYQRARLYIEANGPPRKSALVTMLARFGDDALRRVTSMCSEGMIHIGEDDRVHLGRSPKQPTAPRKHWDPRRGDRPLPPATKTPAEEEKPREASADATSEEPAETRVDACAGDAPDESATGESPAPEIGPAPATIEQPENTMKANVIELHAQQEQPDPAAGRPETEIADGIEKVATGFGNGGGGVMMREPTVIFSLRTDELEIEIGGDDERALTAIRAVLSSLTLSKASAE